MQECKCNKQQGRAANVNVSLNVTARWVEVNKFTTYVTPFLFYILGKVIKIHHLPFPLYILQHEETHCVRPSVTLVLVSRELKEPSSNTNNVSSSKTEILLLLLKSSLNTAASNMFAPHVNHTVCLSRSLANRPQTKQTIFKIAHAIHNSLFGILVNLNVNKDV